MRKNLLVTLADKNYISQVKQVFSSVYFTAGWKGEYMLFSHGISESDLQWFRNKGILVKKCRPLYKSNNIMLKGKIWPPSIFSKFYLFTTEFRKWDNIIFLDGDITVRASLDELTKIKGLGAVKVGIKRMFIDPMTAKDRKRKKLFKKLKEDYNLTLKDALPKESGFNSGVLAFSTDIIKADTFYELKRLSKIYARIVRTPDQAILNLYFYGKWVEIPGVYNMCPSWLNIYDFKPEHFDGIVFHYTRFKPWLEDFFSKQINAEIFYREWKNNFDRVELINLDKILPPCKRWTDKEIQKYTEYKSLYVLGKTK